MTSCYAKDSHSLVIKIYYNKQPKSVNHTNVLT